MRLIGAAASWTGGWSAEAVVGGMLGRPPAWRTRRRTIEKTPDAAVGAIEFDDGTPPGEGTYERLDLLVTTDARFDEPADLRAALGLGPDTTDAQVVAAAYDRWGPEFSRFVRGDLAAILWDRKESRLVATRDPLGVRPLFVAQGKGGCLVASDVEALLATGLVAANPDDDTVIDYLRWTFEDLDATFFREIRRVRPGHVVVASTLGSVSRDCRGPTGVVPPSSRDEAHRELRDRFFTAVRRRLTAPSRVVVQLSGGLDSTTILRSAEAIVRQNPRLCGGLVGAGARHPGLPCDEGHFIDEVARASTVTVETWDGSAADPSELRDTPVSFPGGRYVHTGGTEGDVDVARRIGASVILSGVGGDQIGAPEGLVETALLERRWTDALDMIQRTPGSRRYRVRRALSAVKSLLPRPLAALHDPLKGDERAPQWMTPWASSRPARARTPQDRSAWGTPMQRQKWSSLTNARTVTGVEYIQQHSYRTGIEVRFPFLDLDLVDLVLAIPARFWPPPWPQERIHRDAMGDLLPPGVLARRTKADFSSALSHRVRSQLPAIRGLDAGDWRSARFVDRSAMQDVVASFARAAAPTFATAWAVWGIVTLEAWLRSCSDYTSGLLVP